MQRFCDHIYIVIKDLISKENKHGKLLVCHYCGHKKEVWEDGTITEYKADGTPRT